MKMLCSMLLVAMLGLAGCSDALAPEAEIRNDNRPVATTYKVKADSNTDVVQCFRITNAGISQKTLLKKDQKVKIVAIDEGLRRFNGELWLNIYPRLSHRPNCYVNIDNLIPYS